MDSRLNRLIDWFDTLFVFWMKKELFYYAGSGRKKIHLKHSGRTSAVSYEGLFPHLQFSLMGGSPGSNGFEIQSENLPVFDTETKGSVLLKNQLIVKFKPGVTEQQIEDLNLKHGAKEKTRMPYDVNYYVLNFPGKTPEELLKTANQYHRNRLVIFAQPNFIRHYHNAAAPDPYYSQQWALKNTGQFGGTAGEDIRIEQAWTVTQGDPAITIAIIDTGVDYTHPELNGLVNGQQKLKTGFNALDGTTNQQPANGVHHGTACAGIAAAISNTVGIAGVAPKCSLLGIKISNDPDTQLSDDTMLGNAIAKAADLGADVINCSWSGVDEFPAISNAINYCLTKGRNGKGCVLVFAAGNRASQMQFPASSPAVLAVTGGDNLGNFKASDTVGQRPWGSNFGPNAAICAPGINIVTLNNNGVGASAYDLDFEGTSASAPFVSGTAALMLSANPALRTGDVVKLLKSSARGKPGRQLPDHFYGYGLLDAGTAVSAALAFPVPAAIT